MRYLYIDSCTIKKDIWNLSKPHRYEIAKIELLEAPSRSDREPLAMTSNNSISAAKLLENVEKSYDMGKLILKESERMGKATRVHENIHKSSVVWEKMPTFVPKPIL